MKKSSPALCSNTGLTQLMKLPVFRIAIAPFISSPEAAKGDFQKYSWGSWVCVESYCTDPSPFLSMSMNKVCDVEYHRNFFFEKMPNFLKKSGSFPQNSMSIAAKQLQMDKFLIKFASKRGN